MYITEIVIEDIRSIESARWQLKPSQSPAGWHVIAGDNGSGKTSFLRAIALALAGASGVTALRQSSDEWVRTGQKSGSISLQLTRDSRCDKVSKKGRSPRTISCDLSILKGHVRGSGKGSQYVWGQDKGWFSAGYGSFRRFTGTSQAYESALRMMPTFGRHLSLLEDGVGLTEALKWLQTLRFKQLEGGPDAQFLGCLKTFVNQTGFLPFNAKLHEVTSETVVFVDGNGTKVGVENLGDGYRSILSMTFELIRQLAICYNWQDLFDPFTTHIVVPGVVLIDEIDAHLHPTWQRQVGVWFREHFPNMQFIVTSHSPLVCQAADVGSVYLLPRPGTEAKGHMVQGQQLERLIYGNALDAYSSEVFGDGVTRSRRSGDMLARLAELNTKETTTNLSKQEKAEQSHLRATLPTTAHATEASR